MFDNMHIFSTVPWCNWNSSVLSPSPVHHALASSLSPSSLILHCCNTFSTQGPSSMLPQHCIHPSPCKLGLYMKGCATFVLEGFWEWCVCVGGEVCVCVCVCFCFLAEGVATQDAQPASPMHLSPSLVATLHLSNWGKVLCFFGLFGFSVWLLRDATINSCTCMAIAHAHH